MASLMIDANHKACRLAGQHEALCGNAASNFSKAKTLAALLAMAIFILLMMFCVIVNMANGMRYRAYLCKRK